MCGDQKFCRGKLTPVFKDRDKEGEAAWCLVPRNPHQVSGILISRKETDWGIWLVPGDQKSLPDKRTSPWNTEKIKQICLLADTQKASSSNQNSQLRKETTRGICLMQDPRKSCPIGRSTIQDRQKGDSTKHWEPRKPHQVSRSQPSKTDRNSYLLAFESPESLARPVDPLHQGKYRKGNIGDRSQEILTRQLKLPSRTETERETAWCQEPRKPVQVSRLPPSKTEIERGNVLVLGAQKPSPSKWTQTKKKKDREGDLFGAGTTVVL